jgi:hypothetical protein
MCQLGEGKRSRVTDVDSVRAMPTGRSLKCILHFLQYAIAEAFVFSGIRWARAIPIVDMSGRHVRGHRVERRRRCLGASRAEDAHC